MIFWHLSDVQHSCFRHLSPSIYNNQDQEATAVTWSRKSTLSQPYFRVEWPLCSLSTFPNTHSYKRDKLRYSFQDQNQHLDKWFQSIEAFRAAKTSGLWGHIHTQMGLVLGDPPGVWALSRGTSRKGSRVYNTFDRSG